MPTVKITQRTYAFTASKTESYRRFETVEQAHTFIKVEGYEHIQSVRDLDYSIDEMSHDFFSMSVEHEDGTQDETRIEIL